MDRASNHPASSNWPFQSQSDQGISQFTDQGNAEVNAFMFALGQGKQDAAVVLFEYVFLFQSKWNQSTR
jgi:hypothetical protein